MRSSASKSGAASHEPSVTATTTSSKMPRRALDDVDVPVGDRVVGARAHGDAPAARRGCSRQAQHADGGVAVGPIGARGRAPGRSAPRGRAPRGGLDHDVPAGATRGASAAPSRPAMPVGEAIGRVQEAQAVASGRAARSAARAARQSRDARRARGPRSRGPRRWRGCTRRPAGERSTRTWRCAAPRESASSPRAPEPAKRSSTSSPSTGPTIEKMASRTRSAVGRVSRPAGAADAAAAVGPRRRSSRRRSSRGQRVEAAPGRRRAAAGARAASSRGSLAQRAPAPRGAPGPAPGGRGDRRAKRRSVGPAWRRPRMLPSPRISRSSSARRKPSPVWVSASRRRAPSSVAGSPKSRQSPGCLPAAHAPAQLVELGEAEALGALDQDHGGVGHVDAHLDHGGRHQQVGAALGEVGHGGALLVGALRAVGEPHAERRERPRRAAARPRLVAARASGGRRPPPPAGRST